MKKVIIGALVGMVIFFLFQSIMWMGGFHKDFSLFTSDQDEIMQYLDDKLPEDGLYMMPIVDPDSPNYSETEKEYAKRYTGEPWAMVFFHKSMDEMGAGPVILGIIYSFIASLLVSLILYFGNFRSFGMRWLAAMAFVVFALTQGALNEMNWWSYPWSFIKATVIDLTVGWALCSLWLAWFVKK